MNKTNKGNRRELEARKALESKGYLTERKNASRWQSNDFWKQFDVLAIHAELGEVRLIQVKSNMSDFYKAMGEIAKWVKEVRLNIDIIKVEVWVKENYKDWRRERFMDDEWLKVAL